jgi:hypothetical protein
MRIRRRNTAWLAVLAALIGIVVISGTAPASVSVALIGLFALAAAASMVEIRTQRLLENVPQSPLTLMRMSAPAREAVERARRRTNYSPAGLTLLDVGLISLQSSSEGMVMRRSRSVSLDDDGVRPYITLHIQPDSADRNAVIRYEIIDHNGQVQYVHEMKTYLRDGEMNILADHHLPLTGNDRLTGAGDWDLRVSVDGTLLGLLAFNVTPSLNARRQFIRDADSAAIRLEDTEHDDAPVSLEDLLRSKSQGGQR